MNNQMNNQNVVLNGSVEPYLRSSGPNSEIAPPPKNGGIFGGLSCNKPWMPIPVAPTTTNYINNNLRSANPPPGAIEQYIGTNRLGNNYVSMPGIYQFKNTHPRQPGPFDIRVTQYRLNEHL